MNYLTIKEEINWCPPQHGSGFLGEGVITWSRWPARRTSQRGPTSGCCPKVRRWRMCLLHDHPPASLVLLAFLLEASECLSARDRWPDRMMWRVSRVSRTVSYSPSQTLIPGGKRRSKKISESMVMTAGASREEGGHGQDWRKLVAVFFYFIFFVAG